jgi:type II secretory pathway pseudopilin PulG
MNEDKTPEEILQTPKPEEPKRNLKKILIIIAISLLAIVLGALAYLYMNEKNTNKELSQTRTQLEEEHTSIESSAPEAGTDAAATNSNISYIAEVGKFKLDLPNNYRIVEYIDGPGEGGKGTEIDVALSSEKGAATVNNYSYTQVNIIAVPEQNFGSFSELITSRIPEDSEYTKKDNINISGIEAQVYAAPGLDLTTYYFFEKNNIFYVIKSESSNNSKINDVLKGFSFVD